MTTTTGETVKVEAPATLSEGYTFDATVNGEVIKVSVPPGGVKEGEMFDAPIVTAVADEGALATPLLDAASSAKPVSGAWRHGLFECFDLLECFETFDKCCNGMFWMAWCCPLIAMGQLLQRLKLNFFGEPTGNYKNTCMIWTVLAVVLVVIESIDSVLHYEKGAPSDSVSTYSELNATDCVFIIISLAIFIFSLVALARARFFMREKEGIPADCCDGGSGRLSDCCCACWFPCCVTIQMMRDTHDERQDRYACGSKTGLSDDAEDVV